MADTYNDPVNNPMGALRALSGPTQQMMQQQQQSWNQHQEQLKKLIEMQGDKEPERDESERWGAMASAASVHPPLVGGFGALLANIGGAYGKTLAAQRARDYERQEQIVKLSQAGSLGAGSMTALTQAMVDPYKWAPGLGMMEKSTGNIQLPANLIPEYNKIQQGYYKHATEQRMPNAEEWSHAMARQDMMALMSNRNIAGGRTVPPGGFQAPSAAPGTAPLASAPPAQPGETPPTAAPGAAPLRTDPNTPLRKGEDFGLSLKPGTDTKALAAQFKRGEDAAVASGDYEKANELRMIRQRIESGQFDAAGEAAAPAKVPASTYRNIPDEKGREKTAEESAKMYTQQFEENVVKPAAAFTNTGKMMQDFNNLAQMQSALKSGKFKEFMGGEGGKWIMTVADPKSDLYKGISNAQEAEKLSATMVNNILMAAKGIQTEGDAQRARSQITNLGNSDEANKYLEAYMLETARQLKLREKMGREYKKTNGTYEGYDDAWAESPIMSARGSVKKIGSTWIGLSQYINKFKDKNPSATDQDAIQAWNGVK